MSTSASPGNNVPGTDDESGGYNEENVTAIADALRALRRVDHASAGREVDSATLNARQALEPVLTNYGLDSAPSE